VVDVLDEVVRGEDVAILIGLPLDEAAFRADIEWRRRCPRDGRGDFAWQQTVGIGGADPWAARGRPLCALVNGLIRTAIAARLSDDRIVTDASLDTLARVAEGGARIIVILAHWRGANVTSADLDRRSWEEIAVALRVGDGTVLQALRRFLQREDVDPAKVAAPADTLDAFVESFGADAAACAIVRDALDAELSGAIAPGNSIEFRDGVHKAPVVAAALPDHWSGVIDLSVCHSMLLATMMRAGRDDRRVIANVKPKFLDRVVPELRETLLRLSHIPGAYVPLRSFVAREYSSTILEVH
jgi:hypothetical protein